MRLARRLVATPLGVLACCLALVAPALRAGVLRVPQDHATIQAAVDAAVAGDEIRIAGGEYTETVTLSERSGLTLRGKGTVVFRPALGGEGEPEAALTIEDCTDIRVDRLRFEDLAVGLDVDAGTGPRVTRCRFAGNTSGLLLADNRVIGSTLTGMDLDTPSVRLRGNTVAGTQGAGVVLHQGGALLHGNRFKGNLGADVVDSAEGGEPHFFVDNEAELTPGE